MVVGDDVELVQASLANSGNESFPDSGTALRLQRVGLVVPGVEAADYKNIARIRSPNAEHSTRGALRLHQVRSHFFVNAVMAALIKEVEVLGGQQGYVLADGGDV